MDALKKTLLLLIPACVLVGCGGSEPTVIMPTEKYELTESEQVNRDKEQKMLSEQRQ